MTRSRDVLWSTGRDESVEVNQRALIDKVLARYSGKFTVFRELLQNSDDAQSSAVEIRFETAEYLRRMEHDKQGNAGAPPLPDLKSTHVAQWTFRNNGITFRDEDWARLRKIAEGNPDEEKIGAFGVGFYSLFSVTENPFVSSGGHAMQFYWKDDKDQLNVRRGDLPSKGNADRWTTFEMTLREAGPIPPAFDLMRFLSSSITFMVYLNDVGVYFDDHRIGHVKKSSRMSRSVDLPTTLERSSPLGIMNVKGVQSHAVRIEAAVMHAINAAWAEKHTLPEVSDPRKPKGGFFSSVVSALSTQSTPPPETPALQLPLTDPTELHKMNVTLTLFTAEVDVQVDEKLSREIRRSTKKKPPARLKYHLIYTGKDDYDKSLVDDKDQPAAHGSIFQGLRADLNGATHTRIFIGHATRQTTGIGGHMASYFIPTVEREAIDFVDRNIATWNKELLYIGGLLSRAAYESELSNIHAAWAPNSRPPRELQNWLQERFLHTLKFFAFHPSIPSAEVGLLLEAAFYRCSAAPVRVLSTIGVRKASEIKQYDAIFAKFLKEVPMLPESVLRGCGRTIKTLQEQGMISPITFSDVLNDLRHRQLNREELVSCLRWWIGMKQNNSDSHTVQLLDATVFGDVDGSTLPLSSVRYFANPQVLGSHIPQDSPVPTSLLPQDIAKHFSPAELSGLGWQEFTIVNWLQHISQLDMMSANPAHDFTRSPNWAARVLSILSHIWHSSSNDARCFAKELFLKKTCIPTSCDLCTPEESYLPGTNTGLFHDLELPMVRFPDGSKITGEIETLLLFIGVRKHVDPQLIVNRMAETGCWNITGLIRYLVQVRESLTPDEITNLQSSAIFTKESTSNDTTRYCACDLYAPTEIFRQLELPVIQWDEKSKWSDDSDEAKLLFPLGLRQYPPLEEIVRLCSLKDLAVRTAAFWYFCDNLTSNYSNYDPCDFEHVAFIPAENKNGNHLGKPGNVFSGKQWKALGFSVIQDEYQGALTSELGIRQHPPPSKLISHLKKTQPPDQDAAQEWFEVLFEQISAFASHEIVALSKLSIVPTNSSGALEWLTPAECYLSEGTQDRFYSKLFAFVNFGPAANRFLSACRSRNEPTVEDVAKSLVDDPEQFRTFAGGPEDFLTQLRVLAVNKHRISNVTLSRMKHGSILLGKKTVRLQGRNQDVYELRNSKDIVIADDINAHHLFRDAAFIAPQEELLEEFYASLGCRRLSEVVHEQCKVVDEVSDAETYSEEKRTLVLERLTLFLHEHTYAKPKIPVTWFSDAENFKVKICKKLSISKTLVIGDKPTERSRDASAGAKRVEKGRIELWLSRGAVLDMYEVSTSLCLLLFGTAKVSESLLFTSILSEELEVLRRRGCNVDLILKRHQLEQDKPKVDNEIKGDVREVSIQTSQNHVTDPDTSMPSASPNLHLEPVQTSQSRVTGREASTPLATLHSDHITQALSSRVSLLEGSGAVQHTPTPPALSTRSTKHKSHNGIRGTLRKIFLHEGPPGTVGTTVTPRLLWTQQRINSPSDIRSKIDMAISACNPEEGQLRCDLNKMEEITESLNDRYCHDVSGKFDKLKLVGELPVGVSKSPRVENMKMIKVFATQDVPNHGTFMASKKEPLNRFVNVIVPIAKAYNLSMTSLNIFCDVDGVSIAFNRDGSLFLNLRYFEAWHDQDVAKGVQREAQISWFLTVAHEIAHNVVKAHNSDHAFWFSKLCETRISNLVIARR